MADKHPEEMTLQEIVQDARNLPDTRVNILTSNERALIDLAKELGKRLDEATAMRSYDAGVIAVLRRDNQRYQARYELVKMTLAPLMSRAGRIGDGGEPDYLLTQLRLSFGDFRRLKQLQELGT